MSRNTTEDQTFETDVNEDEIDINDEVQRLARLPLFDYEQCRTEDAKKIGVRVAVLDSEVKRARGDYSSDSERKGQPLGLDDPEPWPDPIDGNNLLDEIVMCLLQYLVLPDGAAELLALWVVHAHAYEAFNCTPRLAITAPEKQCGKTILLDVLETLTPRSIRTENITTAVLFRIVDAYNPTLLIDEFDTFLKHNDELRGAINAGHRRGGLMLRCEGDKNEVRGFKTFAPVALAGIGKLPGTIADRSIQILMRRALPDESIRPFRSDRAHEERELCSQIARWVDDNRITLEHHEPDVPVWMFNRQADNWRPLLAIADIAGGHWPERIRTVAAKICGNADEDTSVGVQLLKDIGELFVKLSSDQLASATIVSELGDMEHRPWPDWKLGKPISAPQVARLLKPFGISPGTIRLGPETPRGYKLVQLNDALRRYAPPQNATPPQVNVTNDFSDLRTATKYSSVAAGSSKKPKESAACGGVADQLVRCGPLGADAVRKHDPDDFEERAAIRQYEGELSRNEAERLARMECDCPTEE